MMHELKILPEFFKAVRSYDKRFEIRKNDRNFKVGDSILLREWDGENGYTGRTYQAEITYITDFAQKYGYVVFGF